jgi:hypothetical protein
LFSAEEVNRLVEERKKGQMSVEEAGRMGGQKGGRRTAKPMVANLRKKSVIKASKSKMADPEGKEYENECLFQLIFLVF